MFNKGNYGHGQDEWVFEVNPSSSTKQKASETNDESHGSVLKEIFSIQKISFSFTHIAIIFMTFALISLLTGMSYTEEKNAIIISFDTLDNLRYVEEAKDENEKLEELLKEFAKLKGKDIYTIQKEVNGRQIMIKQIYVNHKKTETIFKETHKRMENNVLMMSELHGLLANYSTQKNAKTLAQINKMEKRLSTSIDEVKTQLTQIRKGIYKEEKGR